MTKLNSATSDMTVFVYDAAGTLVEEWTTLPPHGTVKKTSYIYAGSRLISTETSSGTSYVTLDHLGSTRVTTDSSGNVTSRKDFMAFGDEALSSQRISGLGYTPPLVRQDYTGYQRNPRRGWNLPKHDMRIRFTAGLRRSIH